jgi:catalase
VVPKTQHFNGERVPERVVHKGSAGHGSSKATASRLLNIRSKGAHHE